MSQQELAVGKICASLKKDNLVKAIFLKGSMGRDEHDDIHIIAPQIIVVFDNLLHLDLFTVMEQNFTEKRLL
ncbi:hypothetical protein [Planococcus versutus]|uniref:hypothetical protein n=1 Tax=Planococcus versutus TaxID=1302659 RepID=UPI001EF41BCA|nr:hypothetical protein [Planococcus versutus]